MSAFKMNFLSVDGKIEPTVCGFIIIPVAMMLTKNVRATLGLE